MCRDYTRDSPQGDEDIVRHSKELEINNKQDKIIPKVTDNVHTGNVLFGRLMNKKKKASSHLLQIPIKYQASTSGGTYSGFDTFSTSQFNTRVLAEFTPKQTHWTVALSGIQHAVNQGDAKVLDLLATEMDSVAADMADNLGTQLYSDGTTNSNKYMTGLDAAVDDGKIVPLPSINQAICWKPI